MNMRRNISYYKLGEMLGLRKIEIPYMLEDIVKGKEQPSLEAGPKPYRCAFYGAINFKDF